MKTYPYRLLAPGPVPLPPEVRKLMAEPLIHHRTPAFEEKLARVLKRLKWFFGTQNPVFMQAATGSGAMESALVNTLSPGDKVLVVNAGKFGDRWMKMSKALGLSPIEISVPWGEAVQTSDIQKSLKENPDAKSILIQASETSTGVLHPIREIANLTRDNPNLLLIVDAITAIGMMDLPMDDWGLDVVVAGSQKAFMLPPGLGFISLSEKAWAFQSQSQLPKFYWDLKPERTANEKNQTRFSSAVTHIIALDWVLENFESIGLESYRHRVSQMAKALQVGTKTLGFGLYPKSPSPALTTLSVPQDIDGHKLRQHIEDTYNITLAGGQDQLKGKILRIGHMGHITDEDLVATVEAIGLSLKDMGRAVDIEGAISNTQNTLTSR